MLGDIAKLPRFKWQTGWTEGVVLKFCVNSEEGPEEQMLFVPGPTHIPIDSGHIARCWCDQMPQVCNLFCSALCLGPSVPEGMEGDHQQKCCVPGYNL